MISITLKTLRKDKKIECSMSYMPCRCGIHFMQLNVIILFHENKLLHLWAKGHLHLPDSYELHFYRRFSKALNLDILGVVSSQSRYSITQDR